MKITKFLKYLLLLLLTLLFTNCNNNDNEPHSVTYDRTVLIYMIAENSLSGESENNIESLKSSVLNNLNNGKLLVYKDARNAAPQLLEIYEENNQVKTNVVKTYESQNSASPNILSKVINDAFGSHISKSNGLILWSHGTSWLPVDQKSWTKSFGDDNSQKMEIAELKQALPDSFFDFIVFDACLMSSVEVAFELKNKAEYILVSPTEVFGQGFPYHLIVKDLFSNNTIQENLTSICDSYFSYYASQTGVWQNVSIALLDTKRLKELSFHCKQIIKSKGDLSNLNFDNIQAMMYNTNRQKLLFDFRDYYSAMANESELIYLDQILNDVVIYKKSAPFIYSSFLSDSYPMQSYSGLSTYIPNNKTPMLNLWYFNNTEWGSLLFE